jgi:hypothetical protein
MTYICFVNNRFYDTCSIVSSKKILKDSCLILSINPNYDIYIVHSIASFLILHNYNMNNSNNEFSKECTNIIPVYLDSIKMDYMIIDPDSVGCCCW